MYFEIIENNSVSFPIVIEGENILKFQVKKNVIGMWDALRGLLVLIVILEHTIESSVELCQVQEWPIIFRVISKSNGVVLFTFFMISGYLFRPKKRGIGKQWLSFAKIYVYTIVAMTAARIIHNCVVLDSWNTQLPEVIIGAVFGATSMTEWGEIKPLFPVAMWFFMVLMNGTILLHFIMKMRNEKLRGIIALSGIFLFFGWYTFTGQNGKSVLMNMPFYVAQTGIVVGLLYIGFLMKKSGYFFEKKPWYVWCFIITTAAGTFVAGQVRMMNNEYRLGILDWVGAVCGAILIMTVYIRWVNPEWKVVEGLMWIGRHSLWIIPLHCVETTLIRWDRFWVLEKTGVYVSCILIFAIRCLMIVAVCKILEIIYKRKSVKKGISFI